MKPQEKHAPEDPAGESFYNLSQFSSKPSPHGGGPHSNVSLRQKAEAHFREREALSTEKLDSLSPESMRTILHELRVHQIELEMQNDELRRAQEELDASRARYFDLYDLAPVGYITASEAGLVLEANLTAATLLGLIRSTLVKQPLSRVLFQEDQDIYYKHRQQLFETGEPQQCELRMVKQDGSTFWAHLSATAAQDEAGRQIAVASGTAESRSVTVARAALLSPFDGLVIRRFRDPGDTVAVGTTVLRVVATDALWSRAWIDENALPDLRDKQTVRVRLGAEGTRFTVGAVDRIGREVDRQTHELLVDVRLTAPPERIAIGQRADVWIELERHKDVVRVPLAYVLRERGEAFCFVDRSGRIARARVKTGLEGTEVVEVTEGLGAGDVVLASTADGPTLTEGRTWSGAVP